MKKPTVLALIIALSTALVLPATVFAQTNLNNPARQESHQPTRIAEILRRIIAKAESRLDRYSVFLEKVQARRNLLAQEGKDVTQLDANLRISRDSFNSAKSTISQSARSFANLDLTQNPSTLRSTIRNEVSNIRQAFNELHQSARNTLQTAKNIINS